jgi:hypothetical protein
VVISVKLEKKLVAYSAIALLIGIASISPLMFLMSAKAETPPDQQPQFSIDIPYAYVGNYWDNNSETIAQNTYGYVYSIAFKTSPNFDLQTVAAEAIFEYYTIEVSSEKGPIGNSTYFTQARKDLSKPLDYFYFYRHEWFESNSSTETYSSTCWENGTSLGFRTGPGADWNRSLGEPETIFITLRRQGWIILNENSTVAHLADPEVILQVQLEKYGNGFLYNNIIPEDELSQIDLLMPQTYLLK